MAIIFVIEVPADKGFGERRAIFHDFLTKCQTHDLNYTVTTEAELRKNGRDRVMDNLQYRRENPEKVKVP